MSRRAASDGRGPDRALLSQNVTLPIYRPQDDPGPDFATLVNRTGLAQPVPDGLGDRLDPLPQGTTVVALRYGGGVLMAGDRRATAGNLISHRRIEKVFSADDFSVVGIAGTAGPAMEMVQLFQLQLEHYEKVEGTLLSLDGKANQLGRMVRNHLPAAMQGLAVVPLFAGYDRGAGHGRLFQYDVTGGRYEEHEFTATGSGSMHATTVLGLEWSSTLDAEAAVSLALRALFTAAGSDTATGGADVLRGIYPVVMRVDEDGCHRIGDDDLAPRVRQLRDNFVLQYGERAGEDD